MRAVIGAHLAFQAGIGEFEPLRPLIGYYNHKQFHASTGRIIYDPFRGEMKPSPFWCILSVDKEITRYYRWWLQKEKHIILQQPAWDAHISIIRGEKYCSKFPKLWKKYHKLEVDFTYDHATIHSCKDKDQPGTFYWIDVECNILNDIRTEMKLPTGYAMHLTIGRTYY